MSPEHHWLSISALFVGLAASVTLAYVTAVASLRRFLFLDVLSDARCKTFTVDEFLTTLPADRAEPGIVPKVLVRFASNGVTEHLLRDPRVVEVHRDSDFENDARETVWLVVNLDEWLQGEAGLDRLERAAQLKGAVILLAPTEGALEKAATSVALARALSAFREMRIAGETVADLQDAPPPSNSEMRLWWSETELRERLVLAQLAGDGYANPSEVNHEAMRALIARSLVRADTGTIASREFARFVRNSVSPSDRASWDNADRDSAWNALRVPLWTGVASLLAAVTVSKPELGVASALVPTLAAGLPSVLKLLIEMATPKA